VPVVLAVDQRVLDHRRDRREPGAAGDHDGGRVAADLEDESPVRSGQRHLVPHREVLEHPPVGRLAALDAPHLKLQQALLGGRVGHRIGPVDGRLAVPRGHHDPHVLAGVERQVPVDLDDHPLGVGGDVLDPRHGAGEVAHRDGLGVGLLVDLGLDGHVRLEARATGQGLALVALEVHQREAGGLAVIDLAVEHLHLAGGAQAVAAGVGQPDPRAQGGVEDGLALLGRRQVRSGRS
jgi:hypothetical protein